jgi:hypothetical protein
MPQPTLTQAQATGAKQSGVPHWLVALALLALALPIAVTQLPPLNDLLGHMGRYHVQTEIAQSAALRRNWAFEWALIGNLGVDLLIVPLSAMLGLERAVWLVALLLPPLFAWGLIRLTRAHHGTVTPLSLFALPFAAAYPYQFGFVNFWLSTALALHLAAFWVKRPAEDNWHGALLFGLGAALLWLAHLYGWAIFLVLAGSHELARAGAGLWQAPVACVWHNLKRMLPVSLPLILMAAQQSSGAPTLTAGFFRWDKKLEYLLGVLRDQNELLDKGTLALMVLVLILGLFRARGRMQPSLAIAVGTFTALFIALPIQLIGSAYADARLLPILLALALIAVDWNPKGRVGTALSALALALLAVRCGVSALGYADYDRAYAKHLRALDAIEPGQRVAVLVALRCGDPWRKSRIEHLSSLAIVRRDAFTNGQWAMPGGQLLTPLGATGTGFDRDPSQFVSHWTICTPTPEQQLPRHLARIPKGRFDRLWLFDFDPDKLPPMPGARLLHRDEATALFAIDAPIN